MRLLPTRKVSHDGKCSYCSRPFGSVVDYKGHSVILRLEFDHVIPVATERRGVYMSDNVTAACQICNRIKSSMIFDSFVAAKNYVLDELLRLNVVTLVEAVAKPRVERICEHCEKTFVSGQPEARFCSERCRVAEWNFRNPRVNVSEAAPPKRRFSRTCDFCETKFDGWKHQRYCTATCRLQAWGWQRGIVRKIEDAKPKAEGCVKQTRSASLEISRQHRAAIKVLARLHEGPATNVELAACGGVRYGARLFELRQAGYNIEALPQAPGIWKYQLVPA